MKNSHSSWSKRRGNHLSKILAKKYSDKLNEMTDKQKRPMSKERKIKELYEEILMSAKAPKKNGQGYTLRPWDT